MALLDVFLFILFEELLPHVLQWDNRINKISHLIVLNKSNPEWDSTYLTLFKIMDSFNKSRQEVYSSESNNDTNCKRRTMANIQKFVAKGQLICHPEKKDGGKKIHVLEVNLSEEEILQRINNLSEHEKQSIRHRVIVENNKRRGAKRNSGEHSPSTSSRKRFKSNTSIEDLPCTSAEVPLHPVSSSQVPLHPVSSSSVEHNQRPVINCIITYNVTIPVEDTQNPLVNQLLNKILNNQVSPPPHPIITHGESFYPQPEENNELCVNDESFYPQPEENNELCVNDYPVVRIPEEISDTNLRLELQDILNEIAANEEDGNFGRSNAVSMYQGVEEGPPENLEPSVFNNGRSTEASLYQGVEEEPPDNLGPSVFINGKSTEASLYQGVEEEPPDNLGPSVFINRSTGVSMFQQVEERPPENPERGVINNEHHFSFPDFTSHEMFQGILGETEPSLGHNDLNEFNQCGSI